MTEISTMSRNKNCNTAIPIVYCELSIAIRIALQKFCIATALHLTKIEVAYGNISYYTIGNIPTLSHIDFSEVRLWAIFCQTRLRRKTKY